MAEQLKNKKSLLVIIPLIAAVLAVMLFAGLGSSAVEVKGADGVTAFVTRMYQTTLNRGPDPQGLASWTNGLRAGSFSGADVARNFIFSPEFTGRNLNNEQFLNIMYQAFFNRAPDPGGFNGWMSDLNSGKSREYVLAGFVNSQEFQALCSEYGINPGSVKGTASSTAYAHPETPAPQPAAANLSSYEQQILNQINSIRAANGLGTLAANQSLTNIARSRSADMLSRNYFSHYTPDGQNIFNILKANGIGYNQAGENLAHSKPASAGSPQVFANAWMNSPSHAANILRPQYGSIGIGLAENSGRRVVTTVFTN